jgi:hypothetical protein
MTRTASTATVGSVQTGAFCGEKKKTTGKKEETTGELGGPIIVSTATVEAGPWRARRGRRGEEDAARTERRGRATLGRQGDTVEPISGGRVKTGLVEPNHNAL